MNRNLIVLLSLTITIVAASNETSAVHPVEGRNQEINAKSFTFEKENDDYGNYESSYQNQQQSDFDQPAYSQLYHGDTRYGRFYNGDQYGSASATSSSIRFPVDEARETLADIHQQHNEAVNYQEPSRTRAEGARGLYPFQSSPIDSHNEGKNGFYGTDPAPSGDPYSINNFEPQEESFEKLIREQQTLALQQQAMKQKVAQQELQLAHYQNLISQSKPQFNTGEIPQQRPHVSEDHYQLYLAQLQQQKKVKNLQQYLQSQEQQQQQAEQDQLLHQQTFQAQLQQEQQYQQYLQGTSGAFAKPPAPKPIAPNFPPPQYAPQHQSSFGGQSPFVQQESYGPAPVHSFESNTPPTGPPSGPPSGLRGSDSLPSEGFYHHPTEGEIYLGDRPPTSSGSIHSRPHVEPPHSSAIQPFAPQQPIFQPLAPHQPQHSYSPSYEGAQYGVPSRPSESSSPLGGHISQYGGHEQGFVNGQRPYAQQFAGQVPQPGGGFHPQQQYLQEIGSVGGIAGASQPYPGQFGGGYLRRRQEEDSFGRRISRAIEEISKNDDLECVPKLVCQMIGTRMSNRPLPGFIDMSSLGTLIQSIPVETPSAIYIRAALLGLTNRDRRCNNAFSRCPQQEDDVLYYLNNHRGGFFKFFSGEDNTLENHHNNKGQRPDQFQNQGLAQLLGSFGVNDFSTQRPSQTSNQLDLLALQNIFAALNQNSPQAGLSSAAIRRPQPSFGATPFYQGSAHQPEHQGFNLASLGSGLSLLSTLAGFFRGEGRSIGRSFDSSIESNETLSLNSTANHTLTYEEEVEELRDVDVNSVISTLIDTYKKTTKSNETKEEASTKQEAPKAAEKQEKRPKRSIEASFNETNELNEKENPVEARIVNKPLVLAETDVRFPSSRDDSDDRQHYIRKLLPQFDQQSPIFVTLPPPHSHPNSLNSVPSRLSVTPVRVDSLPIKTGTGNLVFDSDKFQNKQKKLFMTRDEQLKVLLQLLEEEELNDREREEHLNRLSQYYTNTFRLTSSSKGQYYRPSYSSSNVNARPTYSSPSYSSGSYGNRINDDNSHKIYVTNSHGQNEYYIDTRDGKKYYLK